MENNLVRQEQNFLSGKFDVAVPFELTFEYGDRNNTKICVYPMLNNLACEFISLFNREEHTPFSEEAVKWACDRFGTFLCEYGFTLSPDSEDYYLVYALSPADFDANCDILRLTGDEDYTDLTGTDIKGLFEDGYVLYGAVADGKIVAIANTCEPVTEETPHEVEIGVDTASEYRRMGYGRACVGALIREICEKGHTAVYECASKNRASAALAESFNGRIIRKKIYIVGFRDE